MDESHGIRKRRACPPEAEEGRRSVGIRELKAKASTIVEEVRSRRITYAVTRHGKVAALIMPVDEGEMPAARAQADCAWDNWASLVSRLSEASAGKAGSALDELDRMRR